MIRRLALLIAFAILLATSGPRAQTRDPVVILISFDGWRWDYIDRAPAPNLTALAARGVRAKELIPSFPSLTFPNHYTIVTGLYPAHHGIVDNTMWTEALGKFSMSLPAVRNAAWWGGEPIWVTAMRQQRRAMTMFWPGSEAPINGRPSDRWWPFDGKVTNEDRVSRVVDWLALPAAERPQLVTLYFQEVDHVGHVSGPESAEVLEAAAHLDAALGQLIAGVHRLGLDDRMTYVVVSDHGMTRHTDDMMVFLDDVIDPERVNVISTGEMVQLAPLPGGSVDALYRSIHGKLPHLTFYKRNQVPAHLHYGAHPHTAPIIGVPDLGWIVTTRAAEARRKPDAETRRGAHGFDPAHRDMHGLFAAAGPDLREGLVVEPFQNIHIYDFLCALLKITPAKNDGDANVTQSFLRR